MNRCLSDQALLQCYTGDGAADELAHLKSCLACAGRYKQLEGDMSFITGALEAPPPSHRRTVRGFAPWRVAVSAAAVAAAFGVGWSLRGVPVGGLAGRSTQIAAHQRIQSAPAIQLASKGGPPAAMYAAYVQDEFSGEPCSDANDPLEPGCL
jgi:hypothetical protein